MRRHGAAEQAALAPAGVAEEQIAVEGLEAQKIDELIERREGGRLVALEIRGQLWLSVPRVARHIPRLLDARPGQAERRE